MWHVLLSPMWEAAAHHGPRSRECNGLVQFCLPSGRQQHSSSHGPGVCFSLCSSASRLGDSSTFAGGHK